MLEFCSTNFHCDFPAAALPFGYAFGFMSHSYNQALALYAGHLMPRLYSEDRHLLLEELKVLNMLYDFKDSFLAEHICQQSIHRNAGRACAFEFILVSICDFLKALFVLRGVNKMSFLDCLCTQVLKPVLVLFFQAIYHQKCG